MQGTITTRDVLLHGPTIVRCWGPRTYLRCLRAVFGRQRTTFLAVVYSGRR